MNVRKPAFTAFLLFLTAFPVAAKEKPPAPGPFGGALFQSLFAEPAATFKVEDLDRKAHGTLPDTLKTRLARFTERYTGFQSRLTPPAAIAGLTPTPADQALYKKRQSMERAIISLSSSAGIGDSAAAYAARAVLFSNWENGNGHILAEAVAAEQNLASPILQPYLLLFILYRYRCAYEYSVIGEDIHQSELIAQKYRATLQQAQEHPDPLVRLMAEDLDRFPKNLLVPSTFTKGNVHP